MARSVEADKSVTKSVTSAASLVGEGSGWSEFENEHALVEG